VGEGRIKGLDIGFRLEDLGCSVEPLFFRLQLNPDEHRGAKSLNPAPPPPPTPPKWCGFCLV
jgi:hypothetical protein